MKSPFKFLDSYTLADRDIFFGRDQEITELYRKVFESKILLVYGISGTGKSSLVNCGLASRFDESDWLPVNIRRGNNIIDSLNDEINKQALTPLKTNLAVSEKLKSVYLDHFKPVYLIFDQFEELFIFGTEDERKEFIKLIKEVTESKTQCRIIFIIREEFLAGISEFEYDLPEIFSNRFRVEKMKRANAINAIEGPCKVHNIELEQGFSEELIDKLCPAGNEIELTYLQIYLDRILRLASKNLPPTSGHRSLGEGVGGELKGGSPDQGGLHFTRILLSLAGNVSDLLGQFLDEQIREFEDPETGMAILKSFVSVQGTKKQMTEQEILDSISTFGRSLSEPDLVKYLTKFVDLRILRERDDAGHFELRHDSLATKIYEKFTIIEKDLIEAKQFIENAYSSYEKRQKLLSIDDLNFIAPYEDKLYLSKSFEDFVRKSKNELTKIRKRRRRIVTTATVAIIIVLSSFTIWALKERKKAERAREIAAYQKASADTISKSFMELQMQAERDKNQAIENEQLANKALIEAENAKERALKSETLALIERNRAKESENSSIQSRKEAEASKDMALRSKGIAELNFLKARASSFNYLSQKLCESDPTVALRIAEYSVMIDSLNSDNIENLNRIYFDNNFYRIVSRKESYINAVAFSPDGEKILAGYNDAIARLYDLKGKVLQEFKGHNSVINSVAFSPDGKSILTGSTDRTARLWDLQGNVLRVFEREIIHSVAFSPDGQRILIGSNDACLFDLKGNILQVYEGNIINSIAFSPDGKSILTGSFDACLWDLHGKILQVYKGLGGEITSLAFSPDGKSILTAGYYDNAARLWDLKGKMLVVLRGHEEVITSVAFSPDGKKILTGSGNNLSGWDKTVRLWDLNGNQLQVFKGHSSFVKSIAFSPDGRSILSGSWDGTIRLWELHGNIINVFKVPQSFIGSWVTNISFSPSGDGILSSSIDGTIRLWDLDGNVQQIMKGCYSSFGVFSPNSKNILVGTSDSTASLLDLKGNILQVFNGRKGDFHLYLFSPDGKYILTTGSPDNSVHLLDSKGNVLNVFKEHSEAITSIAFSPDSKKILAGSRDKTACLWDLNGNVLQVFKGHESIINSVAFSPEGKSILTGSGDNITVFGDNTARLWDLNGKVIALFKGHESSVNAVAFSPDGYNILTGSSDKTARLWDLNGNMQQVFTGHRSAITSIAFSPNGKSILTAGWSDNTVRLWAIKRPLKEFQKENNYQELSLAQKIQYGIIESTDTIKVNNNK